MLHYSIIVKKYYKLQIMKAIILEQIGGVDNLMYKEIDQPVPKENEVLVEVKALGLNPVDIKVRSIEPLADAIYGKDRPLILGWDVAGVVKATGAGVSKFAPGDKVFGMTNFPGAGKAYAEYVATPESHLAKMPENVSFEQAAACTLAPLTALQAMKPRVKSGDKILIQAGSGGVGHFAIQIAKHLGAHVTTTCSAKNREFVMGLGADQHIDYKTQAYEEMLSDIDFAFEMLDETTIANSIKVMKEGGKIISIAVHEFPEELQAAATNRGVNLSNLLVQSSGEDMNTLRGMLEDGTLKPHVSKVYDFSEVAEAHNQIESGRTVGKLVMRM